MPLYEYLCDACGHRFEAIQKFADPPVERCPTCGGEVRKLQSAPAFQFKGSGWYVTDYARKDQPAASSGEGSKATTGESKDAATSDNAKTGKTESTTKSSESTSTTPASSAKP